MAHAVASGSWAIAIAMVLAMLCLRVVLLAWAVWRRAVPWSRLLLPGIVLLEGAGLWWREAAAWQVRLGTVIALEVTFLVVAIRQLRNRTTTERMEVQIARALEALVPPRLARLVAFELVVVGLALRFLTGGWRRPVPAGFTYHRECGLRMMLPMLPLMAVADVVLIELVILPRVAPWLAVVVHVLAVYGLIWLVGLYASMRERPHRLVDGMLVLHRGALGHVRVPLDHIVAIEPLPAFHDDWKKRSYCKGAVRMDVAGPSVLELHLRDVVRPDSVLGAGTPRSRVLVAVDEPAALAAALQRDHARRPVCCSVNPTAPTKPAVSGIASSSTV